MVLGKRCSVRGPYTILSLKSAFRVDSGRQRGGQIKHFFGRFFVPFVHFRAFSWLIKHRFRPPGFARGQSSFSTQVLIGAARGLSSLSGFACTFFFLAWGIGATSFFLFCPSAIESVSACYHKKYPFTTFCPNVPPCQVSGHLRHFLYY